MRTSCIAVLILLISACGNREETVPSGIIGRDSMVMIMSDIQIAEAALQVRDLGRNDTTRREAYGRYRYVLEKYGVSREGFESSFSWYSSKPHLFHGMYEEVIDRLNVMQAAGRLN